jgi:hypothetical protein
VCNADAASKVNVEVADPTYLPADAAFENLEEARDDVLPSSQQSTADEPFPRCSIVRVRWRGNVLPASFISTPVTTPSSAIGKASARPYESTHTGGQFENPSHSIFG